MEEKMIRVGFIGAGGMGTTHLESLKVLAREFPLEVTAIADKLSDRRENASRIWPGAKIYSDGDELLTGGNYDLIYIATPSFLHTHFAIAAMRKKCDVFCEKPVCLTEEECEDLEKTAAECNVRFMVGQVVRSTPEYIYLKNLINEKPYGNLRDIVMQRISGNVKWGWEDWFHDARRSGTVVLDLSIHDLDYLRYALGEPDTVSPIHVARFESGMINHIISHLTFSGIPATCEAVWHISGKEQFRAQFRADFDHATVDFNSGAKPSITIYTDDGQILTPEIPSDDRVIDNGMNINSLGAYYLEDKYFIKSLIENIPNTLAPLEEGIESVRLGIRILKQAEKL